MARYSSRLLRHQSANREILHSDSENAPNPKLLLYLLHFLLGRQLIPPWNPPPIRRRCEERRARTAEEDDVVVEADVVALVVVAVGGGAEAAAAEPRVDDIADKTLEGRRRQEPVWKRKRRPRWN